jgi:hypothetical protein
MSVSAGIAAVQIQNIKKLIIEVYIIKKLIYASLCLKTP